MRTIQYQVRLHGGPSDGVVVNSPTLPFGEKLWMPGSPLAAQPGDDDCLIPRGQCRSVYRLSYMRRVSKDSIVTICRDYKFTGFEAPDNEKAPRRVTRPSRSWLTWVLRLLTPWRQDLWLPLPEGRPQRLGQSAAEHAAQVGGSRRT